jgi:hypothetical protein
MRGRSGIAQLPLHGGRAPAWLFGRMVKLAREKPDGRRLAGEQLAGQRKEGTEE